MNSCGYNQLLFQNVVKLHSQTEFYVTSRFEAATVLVYTFRFIVDQVFTSRYEPQRQGLTFPNK